MHRQEWTLEPTRELYERFCRLEAVRSYFYFPAWWARVSREVCRDVGEGAWGRATKAERTALVIAQCDRLELEQQARTRKGGAPCTATILKVKATRKT